MKKKFSRKLFAVLIAVCMMVLCITVTSQAAVFFPSSVVTVMVAVPFPAAVTFPFASTVATFSLLVVNVTFLTINILLV